MNIYQDGQYLANNPDWHDHDACWKAQEIIKIIKKNNLHPKSIIDFGCGTGSILKLLNQEFHLQKTVGFEPYPQVLKIAKENNPGIRFISRPPNDKYQIALFIDVIEHLKKPEVALKGMRDRSKYKIFHIPLALSLQARIRKSPIEYGLKHSGHIHNFTKETALQFLKANDYKIIDYAYTPGAILTTNKTNRQKILNILRRILFPIFPDFTSKVFGGFSILVLTK